MNIFQNILVGIDVDAHGELTSGSRAAVERAHWLAAETGARLSFVHVMEVPEAVGEVQRMQPQSALAVRYREISDLLRTLASSYSSDIAQVKILFGKNWQELIAEVERSSHDLVVLGTRGRGIAGRTLFGSTGNRLLRYCPCPVWTVKPGASAHQVGILVAHDLSEVGAAALRIGSGLARLRDSPLHVLHVLEHKEEERFLGTVTAETLKSRRQLARAELEQQCRSAGFDDNKVSVTISEGNAHAAILHYVENHAIELLCMGTVARSGLHGLVTGNTAENVLPWLQCSLLAIKPAAFQTPVAAVKSSSHLTEVKHKAVVSQS